MERLGSAGGAAAAGGARQAPPRRDFAHEALFDPLPSWVEQPASQPASASRTAAALLPLPPLPAEDGGFSCNVCFKSFKRETNLMFHMATHRDRVVDAQTGEVTEHKWDAPTKCAGCPRVFATKYQAKKHFLRKHFEGEKQHVCTICRVKSFSVKEDWSMHMRSCGRFFHCACGVRLRSQATLKRHCKSNGQGHAPAAPDHTPAGAPHAARAPSLLPAGAAPGEEDDGDSDFDAEGDDDDDDDDGFSAQASQPALCEGSYSHDGDGSRASFETRAHAPPPPKPSGARCGGGGGGGGGYSSTTAATETTDGDDYGPPPPFAMPSAEQHAHTALPPFVMPSLAAARGRKRKLQPQPALAAHLAPGLGPHLGYHHLDLLQLHKQPPPAHGLPEPPPFVIPQLPLAEDDLPLEELFAFFSGGV